MSFARTLLERMSRNRAFRRRLPDSLGRVPIVVSPDASLQFWKTGLESDLFDFAREFVQPGNVVWDVGANVGLFSVSAAVRAGSGGRVIAIEADTWLVGLLRASAAIQPEASAPIEVIPAAASDSLGLAALNIAQRGRASNFLNGSEGSTQTGGVRQTVKIISITLDWLLEQCPPPDVLKIDVEGFEGFVLAGAQKVMSQTRPVILCEVFGEHSDAISKMLFDHGYTLFDWGAKPRARIERATFNTLAIPAN